jgi:phosphoribosyl-dephospho-CoA transferase
MAWPHDLLRLAPTSSLLDGSGRDAPDWVSASLARAPWVVVRRGEPTDGGVPVGVRGMRRAERWATSICPDDVVAVRTPETLRSADLWDALPDVPAAHDLRALAPALEGEWPCWGPTGSVGFTIASSISVLSMTSDLDLLVRCPARPSRRALDALARVIGRSSVRVDCQIETPAGFAHLEDLRQDGPSLMRTCVGVEMCEDP